MEIPHAISLIPLEIPYPPQPSLLFFLLFFGIAQFSKIFYLFGKKIILTYLYLKKKTLEFFFFLPLEIPEKTKLNPWIFHKIVLDLLEIPRPETKTLGNSTLSFLGHP